MYVQPPASEGAFSHVTETSSACEVLPVTTLALSPSSSLRLQKRKTDFILFAFVLAVVLYFLFFRRRDRKQKATRRECDRTLIGRS